MINLQTHAMRAFVTAAMIGAIGLTGCGRDRTVTPSGEADVRIIVRTKVTDDPRTYSVGTVLLRAFDEDFNLLVGTTPLPSNRETGEFDASFDVPAGSNRIILVEPRGSALLPGGGKSESGVAMQGFSDPVDILAEGVTEIVVIVDHFIPDSLRFESSDGSDWLVWKKMDLADSHVVRVHEYNLDTNRFEPRDVALTGECDLIGAITSCRVRIDDISLGGAALINAFQVASVNGFSESAFSDTLFVEFGR